MAETSIALKIDGMTCEGCAQSVQQAVRREGGPGGLEGRAGTGLLRSRPDEPRGYSPELRVPARVRSDPDLRRRKDGHTVRRLVR